MISKNHLKPLVFSAALLGLLVASFVLLQHEFSGNPATFEDNLAVAPAFELPLVSSDHTPGGVRLSDFDGRPVLVNFWASWCNVCRKESEVLAGLHQQAGDYLGIVAIASYDNALDVRQSKRFRSASYPIAIDPDGRTALDYRVQGLPHSVLIDPDGRIRMHFAGPLTQEKVAALLGEAQKLATLSSKKSKS